MNETKTAGVADAGEITSHIKKLLMGGKTPELTPELERTPGVREIHDYLVGLRRQLGEYARGDFTSEVRLRGTMAGLVKAIQANMRHLLWQMKQVESGAFEQRIDYMGEFSQTFNNMVEQLDNALTSLREKEAELLAITQELRNEVEKRGAALAAVKKSEETFRFLAEHDPLTDLLNRRSFFARAEVELARATLMSTHSCVALMDVDHFKSFNDRYGHPAGDSALRHIADLGRRTLRANDIMGRYGGEEFVFLFGNSGLEQGKSAAERIRALIEAHPVQLCDKEVPVTASFGVVVINPGTKVDGILKAAIQRADAAMYRAKSKGRNRVAATEW